VNELAEWIGAAVTALVALGGATWWAITTLIELRHLRTENSNLHAKLADTPEPNGNTQSQQLEEAQSARTAAQTLAAELWREARTTKERLDDAETQRAKMQERLTYFERRSEEFSQHIQELEKENDELTTRIAELVNSDGWLRDRSVTAASPAFRTLDQRHCRAISILNLKGGVGKTTITAHLAGLLGKRGKKVLMVDLDFQRSLSQMLLRPQERRLLHAERRCLQHFLAKPTHGFADLHSCAHLIEAGVQNCWIIANSDPRAGGESLETVEATLVADWVLQRNQADVRLFLREAIHAPELGRCFDYILFDCPPKLTPACLNALAASDYVLAPVILDLPSARAVPHLLTSLQRLRGDLFPHLEMVGVIANLVSLWKGSPIQVQQDIWDDLQAKCASLWAEGLCFFKALIPNKASFAKAAQALEDGEPRLALNDEGVCSAFSQLLTEVEKEIRAHERRHATTVPS
jgi:cellulose biosynthesis protein BcsQ